MTASFESLLRRTKKLTRTVNDAGLYQTMEDARQRQKQWQSDNPDQEPWQRFDLNQEDLSAPPTSMRFKVAASMKRVLDDAK